MEGELVSAFHSTTLPCSVTSSRISPCGLRKLNSVTVPVTVTMPCSLSKNTAKEWCAAAPMLASTMALAAARIQARLPICISFTFTCAGLAGLVEEFENPWPDHRHHAAVIAIDLKIFELEIACTQMRRQRAAALQRRGCPRAFGHENGQVAQAREGIGAVDERP